MANTSYPILYEGSNGSSLNLLAARAPIDLECFPMTAQKELKKHADGAASGVHKFLQDTFTAGAQSAKDMKEVEREVQRMLNKTVQEESSLHQFKAEFLRGLPQVEQSSAWTTDLPAQEKVSKQIEIRVAPEDLYKDRGDHLEMSLWVNLDIFLKRSGTENRNTLLFHGSYAYIKTFRFSLVGAPAAIEQDASIDSDWSDSSEAVDNGKSTVTSNVSNATEWEYILPDIRTLFTGTSQE